ncbi:MAG TPA: glycosyltransferase [Bacteroidota bacterium]|nr:glycosyltransferase [Bacteroidota bacterium]
MPACPSVIAEAKWEALTPAQQECMKALARGTLGWGYRWGSEFHARFSVRSAVPGRLPAGIAMYNERSDGAPLRASAGDIVVCFRPAIGDSHIRRAIEAAAAGAFVLAETDPLIGERFGSCVPMFTSPADLVEQVYRYLESPGEREAAALRIAGRASALVHPMISVVIFAYNAAAWLAETIASALSQDYDNYEIIVVDDGSTDDTASIVRSAASPRLRYIATEHRGAPSARNRGIAEAKGECILWLGADDVLEPRALSSHASVLASHPGADIVYGNVMLCDASLKDVRLLGYSEWFGRNGELPAAMIQANVIPDGGTLIRKSCYARTGSYNEKFPRAHDYEWWCRSIPTALFKHNPATVYRWRWHGGNLGAGSGKKVDTRYEARIVRGLLGRHTLRELFPDAGWTALGPERAASLAHARAAEILASYGDKQGAAEIVKKTTPPKERLAGRPDGGAAGAAEGRPPKTSITYLITSILGVTGGNQTLLAQANALHDRGYRVTIVTRSATPGWCEIRPEIIRVPASGPMWPWVPQSDAVISTYFMNTAELASVDSPVKIYFAQGDQFVFDGRCEARGAETRKLHALLKEMSRMSYLLPGVRFIANSGALAARVEKAHGRKADGVLPVCVDLGLFTPLARSPQPGIPRLLVVGPDDQGTELEPLAFKGIPDIRQALEQLRSQGERFTTVRISNTPRTIFAGFPCEFHVAPPDAEKRRLYGSADILVYASHYDSCPRPPLEAMAAGAAVVCTSTEGALEYCRDGENALLVPVRRPDLLAEGIRRVMHDGTFRERIVRGGLATARSRPQKMEWDELERILALYTGKEIQMNDEARGAEDTLMQSMARAKELMERGDVAGALQAASGASHVADAEAIPAAARCEYRNFLGLCHIALGDLPAAKEAFGEALAIDGSSAQACAGLGDVFRLGGLPEQASTMYGWALKEDPENAAARKGLSALESASTGPMPREEAPTEGETIDDITAVRTDSAFARAVRSVFSGHRPSKLVETGTFIGKGTTTVIASALRDLGIADARFYSIEVNPGLHAIARKNLEASGLSPFVQLLNGLSVPRRLLPGRDDIEDRTVRNVGVEPVYVDHDPSDRVERYFAETDFPDVPDDLLGRVMSIFGGKPDFVLLDSGGHMGFIEFTYLLSLIRGECFIALDDIFHVKHQRSFRQMSSDSRFEIITSVREKAGFCIARFTPVSPAASRLPAEDIARRLAVAGDQFGRKEFAGALQTLKLVENLLGGMNGSPTLDEAVAGVETVRGMSYLGMNDLQNARASFEKALKMQPSSSQACAGLGEVFYLAGLDSEAKVMFEHAVALSENNLLGRAGLAKSNKALGFPVGHSNLAAQLGKEGSAL